MFSWVHVCCRVWLLSLMTTFKMKNVTLSLHHSNFSSLLLQEERRAKERCHTAERTFQGISAALLEEVRKKRRGGDIQEEG